MEDLMSKDTDDSGSYYLVLPYGILKLVERGVLNTVEAWVFVRINHYCRGPYGCIATNTRIGKSVGLINKWHISRIIAKLIKLGLVRQVGYTKHKTGRLRRLETCGSSQDSFLTGKDGKPIAIEDVGQRGVAKNHKTPVVENH